MRIRRAWKHGTKAYYKIGPPKIPKSRRTIDLSYELPDRLTVAGLIGSIVVDAFLVANPHVTLRPDTVPHYTAKQPVIEKVSAQDAQDGFGYRRASSKWCSKHPPTPKHW